ncbi:hypothetical protein chiPu_0000376 [Chiloscyllium punctatum]|uniref:EGF-like domain-containing protein n=1 Tax=Chiloscyllium punctatum TaxID=137246 RepID=A0A401RV43_CHIPU|nr:hypothetical protein [Chiloscyllium punctatum]
MKTFFLKSAEVHAWYSTIVLLESSCASNPCRDNATCVELYLSYTCDCGFNFYYDYTDDSCKEGKSFGGELTMKFEFDPAMMDKTSKEYKELEENVINIFNKSLFSLEGYEETKILEVSCPFGYGGIDCNDAFQLSTVVIGVIAGVIIISMTIGLIYTSIRLKDAKYDEGQPLVNEAKEGSSTMIPRINMGNDPMMMNRLTTRDNDEKSDQKGWNTYDNPTMENEYSRKRYY